MKKRSVNGWICLVLLPVFLTACAGNTNQETKYGNQVEEQETAQNNHEIPGPDEFAELQYPMVDAENKTDMMYAEKMQCFCEAVEEGISAQETLVVKVSETNLMEYQLETEAGKVWIQEIHWGLKNGCWTRDVLEEYPADKWIVEGGYLFFSKHTMQGYDGPSPHTAVRIEPLDPVFRELNETYILPVGYELNNMFLTDWDETSIENLDIYDLFDRLYPMVHGTSSPYLDTNDLTQDHETRIAASEFEEVLSARFAFTKEQIRENTTYLADEDCYDYMPRGYHGCEPADYPYPEVVGYEEESDGTLRLRVNAVYPNYDTADVLLHEVCLRRTKSGDYVFAGNRILRSRIDEVHAWRVERTGDSEF